MRHTHGRLSRRISRTPGSTRAKRTTSQRPRGQIGIIILLIMVVLLTIGLSIATRTTQDLFLSQQAAESARVFNAAEAGVEEALSSTFSFEGEEYAPGPAVLPGSNATVDYSIRKVYALETRLFEGVSVMVDVTGVPAGGGLQIDWAKENDCSTQDPASLYVSVYYNDAGTLRVRNQALGACDRGDGFTVGTSIDSDGYRRRSSVALTTDDLFVRVKPLYNDTHIRVTGTGWTLPVQYFSIRSQATNNLGTETRTVQVNRTLPAAPSVMDYAIVSGGTLVK